MLAGVLAMAPLGVLTLGSLLMASTEAGRSAPVGAAVLLTVSSVVLAAIVGGVRRWILASWARVLLASCGTLAAGGTSLALLWHYWPDARGYGAAIVLAALYGSVVYWVHGKHYRSREEMLASIPERDRVPRSGREQGGPDLQRLEPWSVTVVSPRMRALGLFGAVTFAGTAGLAWTLSPWISLTAGLAGLVFCVTMLAWAKVSIQIGPGGLHLVSALCGLSLVSVSPHDVLGVSSREVAPLEWGGWGLRWTARHTAFIVNGGPGLVVYRASGRLLAVEIPDGTSIADEFATSLRLVAAAAGTTTR